MHTNQIHYILAVDRLKSFGKAAEACFITQSTLSAMIKKYEERIDIKIFDRSKKPISTTEEGKLLVQQLKIIANEFSNLDEITQEIKGEIRGDVKIGAIPTLAPYLFPHFLLPFIGAHPEVQFSVTEIPTKKIIDSLCDRSIDIGIAAIPLKHKDLIEIPLYDEHFVVFDKTIKLRATTYEMEDFDLNRLWLLEEGHCMRTQVAQICNLRRKKTINGNLVFESGTISTLLKLVDMNDGITLLPYLATLDLPDSYGQYIHPFSDPKPARKIGLVIHKNFAKKTILTQLEKSITTRISPLLSDQGALDIIPPL